MKLVRRKLKTRRGRRKRGVCVFDTEFCCPKRWDINHYCDRSRYLLMPGWLDPEPRPPRKLVRYVRPRKGRRLIYPPLGWDQLTFPFPFVLRK